MGTKAAVTASTYQEAVRKARGGHRDWLAFTDKNGNRVYKPATGATVKEAMLAMGTKGSCTLIGASDGVGFRVNWRIALNLLGQAKIGWRPAK